MIRKIGFVVGLFLTALWPLTTMAQQEGALDLEEVRTQRELAESNEALDEAIRSQILELYDSAISSLVAAAASETQVRSFERERARIRERIESLRERLSLPSPEPEVTIPEGATAAAAERVLAEERSRLAASRAALAEAEQLARQRAEIRNELSRRLGALEQETETVTEELAAVTVPSRLKAGRSLPSDSAVTPARGCSSRSNTTGSPRR